MSFFLLLTMEDVRQHESYRAAEKFANDFKPITNESYKSLFDYSRSVFSGAEDAITSLDTKAWNMVRYLGPGSGILSVGLASFASNGLNIMIPIVPGIVFIIVAIILALRAIMPCEQTLGASIESTLRLMEKYKNEDQSLGHITAGLVKSTVYLRIVADKKAALIRRCHLFYSVGLFCIVLGIPLLTLLDELY